MTQLDNITWFPQILWLFIIFFSLYVLIYKYFGPLSFFNQQMRAQKIKKHYSSIVFYDYLNVDTRFKRFNVISSKF
jgi:hypothetical protein